MRAGELLRDMKVRGERQTGKNEQNLRGSHAATPGEPTLSDLGVSKTQSSRWQRLAALEPEQRELKIERAKRKAISAIDGTAKLERAEMRAADEARVRALRPIAGKFRTLVVDPPWDYEWLSLAGRAAPSYATMTQEQLLSHGENRGSSPPGSANDFIVQPGDMGNRTYLRHG